MRDGGVNDMKNYKIAVAGTGYVGLSIATLLSQHHHVTAVDIIPEKVEMIHNRKSPIQDDYIEKYLAEKELNLTVKGFVYLSSMEVYGSPLNDLKIDEKHGTNLDTMKVRSCYPESKRMCESLCASYSSEFGVPAKVVRLTQTFGPGVKYDDGRVFAEFARCAIERRNIVLKTKGETRRSYLYTEDAVNAILTVLYNGIPGQAYNAANEETYCSIYEMAKMVAGRFGDNSVKVLVEETNPEKLGYAPVLYMNLDTTKLHNLGWKAKFNLESMYQNMIEDMKINQKRY